MFSGIVRDKLKIKSITNSGVGRTIVIEAPRKILKRLRRGDSVMINGICLTVESKSVSSFTLEVMPQTVKMTSVPYWKEGFFVNFEPSLQAGDDIGGHFIYGHVDELGELVKCGREGTATLMRFRVPREILEYIVPRASISVSGISLTVVDVKDDTFKVSLLPSTVEMTVLSELSIGDKVNIEVDMLMRMVAEKIKLQK